MKKLLYCLSAMMVIFLAGSCQQELNPVTDGDTNVTFTVNAGDVATRADIADGTNVDILYWEIYKDVTAAPLGEGSVKKTSDKIFTVELKLLADQDYTIIFWAEVENAGHYNTEDLRNVEIVSYDDEMANDESRAAFFRVYEFSTENGKAINEDVYLYRPFSQINLGTTTYATSFTGGNVVVDTTEMTVTNIATSFNTLDGVGEGEQEVTFQAAPTPNGAADRTEAKLIVNDLSYYWIGMNYLIVNGESDNVTVDVTIKTQYGDVNHIVESVPVKENYRTNLLGNFLTTGATFNVVVDERFQAPDYIVPVPGEDGNGSSNTYTVSSAAELVWLQQQVNKEGNTFEGKTVKLTADIDLQGAEWTPIDGFKGTFDGSKGTKAADDNYTISNFTVNVNECGGLFGSIVGSIKNVNIENATVVSNHFAGALVGYAYGRIENCHANNVTVTTVPELINGKYDNGDKAGAIVGYICGEPMSYLVNCSATNATVTAYRDLGAVAGCIAGTMTVQGNTAKDCKIVVDQIIDGEYAGSKTENANPVVGRNQSKNVTAAEFEEINKAAESVDNTVTTTPEAGNSEQLKNLVKEEGAVVEVPAGEYTFPSEFAEGVTVNCAEGTVFKGTSGLNVNGATVIGATFENDGIAVSGTVDGTFKNCTFDGSEALRWCYTDEGDEILFEDCVIKTDFRGFHFDDMKGNVTFRRCEINGFNAFGGEGTATFENCVFGNDESSYNGLNIYSNTVLKDCKFVYNSGKTNFIDMEGTGKTLSITNCTATLDGTETPVIDFVGGSKLANNTVILDGKTYASSQTSLSNALNNGATEVLLKDGNYTMPEPDLRGKGLTITGSKDVVIDVTAVDARDQFVTGATLKFEGVTLNFGKVNYMGFANTASLTYKDCNINGLQFLYGENVVFEDCDLDSNGAEHTVWTYGVKNVSFTGCDFTYGDRGVNCYSDNDVSGGKQTVNFTNCTFATDNTASEGAVEINSCFFSVGIEVNMDGCTAPAYGEMAYVSPWDSTNGAKTTINIK